MKQLFERLLKDWCDGLLRLQVTETESPERYGGIQCPACDIMHGRSIDAVYPLMHMAARTGQRRYLDAAVALMRWSENVSQPDGSYYNEIAIALWKGTTVFSATAIADALTFHGQLLDKQTKEAWTARLRLAGEYLYDHVAIERWNINYPAVCSYTMVLLGSLLDENRFKKRGRELAHKCMDFLTAENKLLAGEGGRQDAENSWAAIDLGYNVEESLPGLILYAKAAKDEGILGAVTDSLKSHLEFMLPDGAWDNSWGTRNYKWTYWGSRTADGCHPGYVLLAERDPAFAEAAYRNTSLLASCTHDGVLYGGPHYVSHGVPACVHHTFCHAKALATVLDHGAADGRRKAVRLPRENGPGVREFPEIRTWLMSSGPWRGTITAYGRQYHQSHHASGGALSMLWHEKLGPILTASLTEYFMAEPTNMQVNHDRFQTSLTPRLELNYNDTLYTNVRDQNAEVTYKQQGAEICFSVRAKLVDKDQAAPSDGDSFCRMQYHFRPEGLEIFASMEQPVGWGQLNFVLPIISKTGEKVVQLSENSIRVEKPNGCIEVSSSESVRIISCEGQRVFNHVPGFEAVPLVVDWKVNESPELRIQIETNQSA